MRICFPPRILAAASAMIGIGIVAGCAPRLDYRPAANISTPPASLDLARTVDRTIEDRLSYDGDFHPNDLIRLSFPYLPLMDANQRVQLSGEISPPLLAPIQTRGLTVAALEAKLVKLYGPKLEQPTVSVSVVEYNRPPAPPEIFVMGEVTKPGAYGYRDGTTPFEGLARAGGGTRDADLSRVVVLMPEGDHIAGKVLDLRAVLRGTSATLDDLPPFSVLIVPPTRLAREADHSRLLRTVVGFNGLTFGSAIRVDQ